MNERLARASGGLVVKTRRNSRGYHHGALASGARKRSGRNDLAAVRSRSLSRATSDAHRPRRERRALAPSRERKSGAHSRRILHRRHRVAIARLVGGDRPAPAAGATRADRRRNQHFHDALAKARDGAHLGPASSAVGIEKRASRGSGADPPGYRISTRSRSWFAGITSLPIALQPDDDRAYGVAPKPVADDSSASAIVDVHIRVLSLLLGLPDHDPGDVPKGANAILVTHDLTPSLTVQLDREAIAAVATDAGTRISHVAILARSLGLPAVVGLRDGTQRIKVGDRLIRRRCGSSRYPVRAESALGAAASARRDGGADAPWPRRAGDTGPVRLASPTSISPKLTVRGAQRGRRWPTSSFLVVRSPPCLTRTADRAIGRSLYHFFVDRASYPTYDIGGDNAVGGRAQPNPCGLRAIRCASMSRAVRHQLRRCCGRTAWISYHLRS